MAKNNTVPFLGIGEGKVTKAKADAAVAIEAAKLATLKEKAAIELQAQQAATKQQKENAEAEAAAQEARNIKIIQITKIIAVSLIAAAGFYLVFKMNRK